MQLPAELRLKVYHYHLIQNHPIELWPHLPNNNIYTSNWRRAQNFNRFIALGRTLSFLRVSSRINEEAAQVFYGSNEFRFSGINGWMVLSAFLYTIGPRHYRFLQSITIHVPFPGKDYLAFPTAWNREFSEKACILRPEQHRHFRARLRRIFQIPENWTHDWSVADCVRILATTHLRTLRLVLPPTYYITHDPSIQWYWDRLEWLKKAIDSTRAKEDRESVDVGFVFLKISDERQIIPSAWVIHHQPWLARYTGQVKTMMERLKETEWITSVMYGVHDSLGRYKILDREACLKLTGPKALQKEEISEEDWLK